MADHIHGRISGRLTMINNKRESNSTIELAFMRLLLAVLKTALLIVATIATAQAEPRQRHAEHKNYIIRRQQAGSVTGVPTLRRIRGGREIDIYRNGLMFEGDNVVGVVKGKR